MNEEAKTHYRVIAPRKKNISGFIHPSVDELGTTPTGWLTNYKQVEF
jgi:hypothetical protein